MNVKKLPTNRLNEELENYLKDNMKSFLDLEHADQIIHETGAKETIAVTELNLKQIAEREKALGRDASNDAVVKLLSEDIKAKQREVFAKTEEFNKLVDRTKKALNKDAKKDLKEVKDLINDLMRKENKGVVSKEAVDNLIKNVIKNDEKVSAIVLGDARKIEKNIDKGVSILREYAATRSNVFQRVGEFISKAKDFVYTHGIAPIQAALESKSRAAKIEVLESAKEISTYCKGLAGKGMQYANEIQVKSKAYVKNLENAVLAAKEALANPVPEQTAKFDKITGDIDKEIESLRAKADELEKSKAEVAKEKTQIAKEPLTLAEKANICKEKGLVVETEVEVPSKAIDEKDKSEVGREIKEAARSKDRSR